MRTIAELRDADPAQIVGMLHSKYASDGFQSQYTTQTRAWDVVVPMLISTMSRVANKRSDALDWTIVFEYPLYRLRRRIDFVILAGPTIVVLESKVGATEFNSGDRRQVEEYALDLRDFHLESLGRPIQPILWCTAASSPTPEVMYQSFSSSGSSVRPVIEIGKEGLEQFFVSLNAPVSSRSLISEKWDKSAYRPVPNVVEAATRIFAGHDVREIANAGASNLAVASERIVGLIEEAKALKKRYLVILTGVPGSGKTLAGLDIVHRVSTAFATDQRASVYLSGNVPLVVVLREALARDQIKKETTKEKQSTAEVRRNVRVKIQHLMDFLTESVRVPNNPPHEHAIVFDEAQRAWDEKQGQEKFNRTASESALILEMMSRHLDWCACVCLIGGGQEINSGEEGVFGWGDAVRKLRPELRREWSVFAPSDVLFGGPSAGSFTLGELPPEVCVREESDLQLRIPQRTFRSPAVSRWVDHVLDGDAEAARSVVLELQDYPLMISRSLEKAKEWLRGIGGGERRYGLVASSGARRLRADGLGVTLHATSGNDIANWYLNPPGDIRSSYALEVPANEYTCQGLELDFACVCWGGDLLWNARTATWSHSRLSGSKWQRVSDSTRQRFAFNKYRVLLTRSREGMILWVPTGSDDDVTRSHRGLDETARFLETCGAISIDRI